jgi:NRAMP (natural resistance-associated macrophage protein)-like metal ion transporter
MTRLGSISRRRRRIKAHRTNAPGPVARFLRLLGPGLITGAADDDPSGIATYSQTGAQFGFAQLWTALYQLPLLIAVQECCARIGLVEGEGLSAVIKRHYSRRVLIAMVLLVLVANVINIGADIGAVGAAIGLVIPGPVWLYAIGTAALVLALEVLISYRNYARVLKWTTLVLLSYPATAFMVDQPWGQIFRATFFPRIEWNFGFLFLIVGVFGTSISPYMFFWQASQEVEEEHDNGFEVHDEGQSGKVRELVASMRIDTTVGMLAAELAQWFIIVTTGSVLYSHGVTNIASAADAARALEPLVRSFPNSGQVARDLFAVGIVGLGLIGIPVLAGSAAYALAEALGWEEGLARKFQEARGFYGIIIAATLLGLSLNFVGVDPFKALVFTAVLNGIAAVPLLFVIARINQREDILGELRGGLLSRVFVWLTVAIMGLAVVALVASLVTGSGK